MQKKNNHNDSNKKYNISEIYENNLNIKYLLFNDINTIKK